MRDLLEKRWMGLDIGEKRIGIALSDLLGLTAQGHSVYQSSGFFEKDVANLQKIALENEVGKIVIGLPKNMNNTEGPTAEKSRLFGEALGRATNLPVIFFDERLSTSTVEKVLIEADVSRRKRKKHIDKLAAVIILQNFLDTQKQ